MRSAPPDHPLSELNVVTPDHFRAAGIRLVVGRDFDARGVKGAPPVGIVNEEFARRFLKGGPALGRTLHDVDSLDVQVIGVVRTARVRSLREEPRPTIAWRTGVRLAVGAGPHDLLRLVTWGAVGSVLLGACLVASAAPARRALKLDPVVALRGEG